MLCPHCCISRTKVISATNHFGHALQSNRPQITVKKKSCQVHVYRNEYGYVKTVKKLRVTHAIIIVRHFVQWVWCTISSIISDCSQQVCNLPRIATNNPLASCFIYARALLEYVIIIMWLRSVIKMLRSVKFAEDKVLTFLILRENCWNSATLKSNVNS